MGGNEIENGLLTLAAVLLLIVGTALTAAARALLVRGSRETTHPRQQEVLR